MANITVQTFAANLDAKLTDRNGDINTYDSIPEPIFLSPVVEDLVLKISFVASDDSMLTDGLFCWDKLTREFLTGFHVIMYLSHQRRACHRRSA